MEIRSFFWVLCAALFLSSIDTAAATSTRFDDWELICPEGKTATEKSPVETGKDPARLTSLATPESDRSCRLQQAQAVSGGKDVVFLFNIVMQRKKTVAIISTPLNVYLPAGLELRIDGGGVRRAVFETCNVTGCHAGFALDGALLAGLRRGKALVVTLKDSKISKIPVRVSLTGIASGLKALAEQNR